MTRWKFVRHEGATLHSVGVDPDGTLHNPNGYPEDVVRAACAAAGQRRHARRSAGARKAAGTRRRRTEARIYQVARRIVDGHVLGPASNCQICGRGLGDPDSIERGIGSECWQAVLGCIKAPAS